MTKRLLLVGNANHYFNKKLYSLLIKQNEYLKIDILNTGFPVKKDNLLPYDNVFENEYHFSNSILSKMRGVKGLYFDHILQKQFVKICKQITYDFVHFQSIAFWSYSVINRLKSKVYVTVWGSDFYRIKTKNKRKLSSIMKKAHILTVATDQIKQDLISTTFSHEDIRVIKFGLEVFDQIDSMSNKMDQQLKDFTNITIGYNRHFAQQHKLILSVIASISTIDFNKIKFVLPFTYGTEDHVYRKEIELLLKKIGANYIFLEDFMDSKQMAETCLQSDIMIQLQTSDAFSGSMQEYMYAGNLIITGSWLPYRELKNNNVYFKEIKEIIELKTVLPEVLDNLKQELDLCRNNKKPLYNLSSWSSNFDKWNKLYV